MNTKQIIELNPHGYESLQSYKIARKRERGAARAALAAHDALSVVNESEPIKDEDGTPIEPDVWMHWHVTQYKPAYGVWDKAMRELASTLGDPDMSRHPFNFRPLCEAILGESK